MGFAEHVDLDAIAQRGIKLGYTPDVLTEAGALLQYVTRSLSLKFLV